MNLGRNMSYSIHCARNSSIFRDQHNFKNVRVFSEYMKLETLNKLELFWLTLWLFFYEFLRADIRSLIAPTISQSVIPHFHSFSQFSYSISRVFKLIKCIKNAVGHLPNSSVWCSWSRNVLAVAVGCRQKESWLWVFFSMKIPCVHFTLVFVGQDSSNAKPDRNFLKSGTRANLLSSDCSDTM
jgi:hypothetical protein